MKPRFISFMICFVVLSAWPCFPLISDAAGPVHGARGAGMGTAFLAVADDPSSIIYNPAGLSGDYENLTHFAGMSLGYAF